MKIAMSASALALALCVSAGAAPNLLNAAVLSAAAAKWNQSQKPQRIYGDTYYVGVAGLSSILIHGKDGAILIDGDLPQSATKIEASIRALGFDLHDVKVILNSHAHMDHAGGIAQLQRDSGATVLASPNSAQAMRAGHVSADDPQAAFADTADFPAVADVREIADGEIVRVGALALTAHFTPGHTPGSTSWTWRECEKDRCLNIVYADSLSAMAAPGFRFSGDAEHADRSASFHHSIDLVGALPCDILITTHPDVADVPQKLAKLAAGAQPNPFIDNAACKALAHDAAANLDERLAKEHAAANSATK